jgi:hypothetical protein
MSNSTRRVERAALKSKASRTQLALSILAKNQDELASSFKRVTESISYTLDRVNTVLLVLAKAASLDGEPGALLSEFVKEQEAWLDSMKNLEEKSDNSSMEKTPTTETALPEQQRLSDSSGSIL